MNLKIALATALLLTGGVYAADAQQKAPVTASATAAKSFNNKIKEYQSADERQSAPLLAEIKQMMVQELGNAKAAMATADESTREKMMKQFEGRTTAMNEANKTIDAGGDKKAVTAALKKFAATL